MAPIPPKKTLPKRLSPLDAGLDTFATLFASATAAELPGLAAKFESTPIPKSDLHHWIAVLNHFDSLLKDFVEANTNLNATTLGVAQSTSEKPSTATEDAIVAILTVSRILWDNCTSRTLYASYEHVMALLYSPSLPILNAALLFLTRPPQRQSKPKAAKLALAPAHDRLTILAQRWGSKEDSLDLGSVLKQLREEVEGGSMEEELEGVFSFQFYYSAATTASNTGTLESVPPTPAVTSSSSLVSGGATPVVAAAVDYSFPSTPTGKSFLPLTTSAFSTPSQQPRHAQGNVKEKREGLVNIHVPNVYQSGLTEKEFIDWVVKEYGVPESQWFGVVHRVRVAFARKNRRVREELLRARVLALCVCACLLPEDVCQSKFFLYEPDLPAVLAEIAGAPVGLGIDYNLQAAALYALESFSRHKSKAMEILTALGAAVNHGILVSITRRVIHLLESPEVESPDVNEFIDAYFSLLSQFVNSNHGGAMLVSSGIVGVIVKSFGVTGGSVGQMKNISRFVTFLDLMIYNFPTAFGPFTAAGGVDLMVSRIKIEVNVCSELKKSSGKATLNDISFTHVAFLRALLKYVMHMMQISGMADQLRNLIETTLPSSVLKVFEDCLFYGANVFGLAINIMSTFIHNEPASLPILQEMKMPQTLLDLAYTGTYPLSAEVISALPSAFGAMCLNQSGLDAFTATNPLPRYLHLLIDLDPLARAAFLDRDMPSVIGGAVDELVRHHPSLKEGALTSVIDVLKEILAIGAEQREDEAHVWRLRGVRQDVEMRDSSQDDPMVTSQVVDDHGAEDKKESRVGILIDVFARFLEGLFQNPTHSKEFIKLGGIELLVNIYSLPGLPVDFALSSSAGYSLVFLFRVLIESGKEQVIPVVQDSLIKALENVQEFVTRESVDASWSLKCIDFTDGTVETSIHAQQTFRAFIHLEALIRLTADMFSSHHHSHSKSVHSVILSFTGEKGVKILPQLAALHRSCLLEAATLKNAVPKTWYDTNPKKPATVSAAALSRQVSSANLPGPGPVLDDGASDHHLDASEEDPSVPQDYRMMNTYYFKEFFSQIPNLLTTMYQSVVRVLTTKTISKEEHRKPAAEVIHEIALAVNGSLQWKLVDGLTPALRLAYLGSVMTVVEGMVTDKRQMGCLQTSWVSAFDKCGGIEAFIDLVGDLWSSITVTFDVEGTEEQKEFLVSQIGLLERGLRVLSTLVDMKATLNSPFTFAIHGKVKDKSASDYFDGHEHLVRMRCRVFPIVQGIWSSKTANLFMSGKPGSSLWKPVMASIMQILKADGEVSTAPASSSGGARDLLSGLGGAGIGMSPFAQALFGRSGGAAAVPPAAVVPDPDRVNQLIDMGYPRGAAEQALIRCGNNLLRAVDYILSHPALIHSSQPSSSSTVTPATAAVPTTPATGTSIDVAVSSGSGTSSSAPPVLADLAQRENNDEEMDEQEVLAQAMAMSMTSEDAPVTASTNITSSAMDVGTPVDSVTGMEDVTPTKSTSEAKGKEKLIEKSDLDNLNDLRTEFLKNCTNRCLELAGIIDFITFDLKDVLCLVGRNNMNEVASSLFAKVTKSLNPECDESQLSLELHLVALMLNDSSFRSCQHESKRPFFDEMINYFVNSVKSMNKLSATVPKWLPSAILIVEVIISDWEDKISGAKGVEDNNIQTKSISVLQSVMCLLEVDTLDSDSLHACLRVLVRLTRSHLVACTLVEGQGLNLLFKNGRLGEFPAQLSLVSVILRHIVESKTVLAKTMESEISNWFKTARSKDMNSFVKGNAPLVCRNAEIFKQVVLANYCIAPNMNVELAEELHKSLGVGEKDLSKALIQFLISELLDMATTSIPATTKDEEEKLTKALHFRRGYLLQALSELVGSYNVCKNHVAAFTRGSAKPFSTPNVKQSARHPLIHHLLTDLLPLTVKEAEVDPASKYKLMESTWSAALITQLCTGPSVYDDKTLNDEHQSTCKTVVDALSRSIKDALASTENADARYGRFLGLADVTLQILNIRYAPQLNKIPASQNPILAATKILAEIDPYHPRAKTLTTAVLKPLELLTKMAVKIAKLPVNSDKPVMSSTKKTPSNKMIIVDVESDLQSSEDEGAGLGESENEEISNIYRNSSLGMYHANPEDIEMDDVSDSDDGDDEEDQFDDFSDDEFSGEEGDAEEDSDNSDPEDDMEIVVPQPYHGAHEEFDSTDNEASQGETDAEMGEDNSSGYEDIDEGEIEIQSGAEDDDNADDDEEEDNGIDDREEHDDPEEDGAEEDGEGEDDYNEDNSEDDDDDLVIPFDEADGQLSDEGGNDRNRRRRIWDAVADGFEGGDLFDRPIPLNRPPVPQEEAHPLLINNQHLTVSTNTNRSNATSGRGLIPSLQSGQMDLHSFIQTLVGPQAIEQIQELEREGQPFSIEVQSNGRPIGDIRDLFRRGGGDPAVASELLLQSAEPNSEERTTVALHTATIQTSQQRYVYEARLLFGAEYTDAAMTAVDSTLALLLPAALEERKVKEKEDAERRLREQEERRLAEEKRRKAEEEATRLKAEEEERERARVEAEEEAKRLAKEENDRLQREEENGNAMEGVSTDAAAATTRSQENGSSSEQQAQSPVPEPPARIFVEIDGQQVDISDSGIDPEFLLALPDDLRAEVLNQHLQEQRQQQRSQSGAAPVTVDNPDMSEFLNALPPDIRNEVLQQQRRPPATNRTAQATGPAEVDPAAFLAGLDPNLRQAVMLGQDNEFLGNLPPAVMAEANAAMRSMARLRQGISNLTRRVVGGASEDGTLTPPAKVLKKSTRDVVQLVEKPALFTLLRLLFVPEPANKETLNRLLLNLCENSKSRLDLISIFLSILWDGNADFVLLDKNFAQMSLKAKGKQQGMAPGKSNVTTSNVQPFEAIPNLIVQRCLETLIFLVGSNDQIVVFFLHENEQFASTFGKYRPQLSKKGKGKEKTTAVTNVYPVVVLLSLVERPIFLSNPVLLEQLVQLLTFVLRPISSLGAKAKDAGNLVDTPRGASDSQNTSSNEPSSTQSENPPVIPAGAELAEDVLKVPMIPDQYVRAIVQVLTVGECSIKTFQYTLSMIQHLVPLNNNREIITNELIGHSQSLGNSIVADLNDVAAMLATSTIDVDVNSGPLAKFSNAASQQAKFLRVLKTLDYIHSKLAQSMREKEKVTSAIKAAIAGKSSGPTPMDAESESSSKLSIEENMAAIYNKIDVAGLWHALGNVMGIVSENEDLTRVGTVLLPLIEAFMVISKPFVSHKGVAAAPAITARLTHSSSALAMSITKDKDTRQLTHEELFNNFTEEHKKILNVMVRNNPTLMNGSFSLLIQNPKVLEFDNKRTYFTQQLHKKAGHVHYGSLPLNVRRAQVFEDSYHQLHGRSGDEIKFGKLNIRFHDEEGVDAGGVTREFFQVLARQMFNPDYALFKPSAVDKVTYQPNRSSWINPDHLLYFRFVGRIIGKAIYDGRLLDAYFTRSFYKCMLEAPVDWKDMEAIDPSFHKSLQWILENDITDVMDLTFSTEVEEFGVEKIIDLKENGRNIAVTDENKKEYVSLITEQRLTKAIQEQINAFLGGFHDIIPKDLIKIFNEQELELLISGLPDIDIDDMKNNTEYQNYTQSSPQIQWFWRAVRSFSQEERAKLIQFATGTSKVPLEGFKALEGSNGIQKFQIHKDFASKLRLPSAHTCFNQIDLPEYDCYEDLRANLLTAISECATGFGFV
ncbi:hypothetical protein BCR33DRAFT_850734 [Rhizoclosmatium globosum]|uniref:HECT-type E3 ubiquitin transferase n=1 Tax=Rhizoclosmatium globosum TaxID=329046 RepID=A0A1Y2CAM7_9FUNG|nr:hypothetical protein BCR33DRAFT_850734 [Rhizoclosmatium globosum]|eukprot:ORY44089.1 hypothetical protein BCR33DRAFT_850734 [Rhizoclosmatium globosum]